MIASSSHTVVHTGAGISTAAGEYISYTGSYGVQPKSMLYVHTFFNAQLLVHSIMYVHTLFSQHSSLFGNLPGEHAGNWVTFFSPRIQIHYE